MAEVAVVGAGVVGLSCALELASAGHEVTVVSDRDPLDTVSAVAGALWFPYQAQPREAVTRWGDRTRDRLLALSADPATGIRAMDGVMVHRGIPDLWWATSVPDVRPARPDELPAGAPAGTVCRVPLVTMPRYLPWLAREVERAGVVRETRTVGRVTDLGADVVVVAAGLRSGTLTGDAALVPVRGQVVRLPNPGLTRWLVDEDHPGGLTYVLPRHDDVVCGGTAVADEWDTEPDPEVERAILDRVCSAVPELAGLPVVGRAVGLRPGAPTVRLAAQQVDGRRVVTCYGHGGAGVTLSWGCAAEVVDVVASVVA